MYRIEGVRLFIIGPGNRIPEGIGINVFATALLLLLLAASWRTPGSATHP